MMLKIKEIFLSIQGEGPYVGYSAIFVRLAGCNLTCSFCDEHHASPFQKMTNEAIVKRINSLSNSCTVSPEIVVITGGEPFLQDFSGLVNKIHEMTCCDVHVETNGTFDADRYNFPYDKMIIVCSPKKDQVVHPTMCEKITYFKFVVKKGDVIYFICPTMNVVYVQPIDENDKIKNEANIKWAIHLCIMFNYRISLQTHKILKVR